MAKFHISKKGVPAECKAKEGNCPLGSPGEHFENPSDAQEYADSINQQAYGILPEVENGDKKTKEDVLKEFSQLAEETNYVTREIILGDGTTESNSEWLQGAKPGDKIMLEVEVEKGLLTEKLFTIRLNGKTHYANEPRNKFANRIKASELKTILEGVNVKLAEPDYPYDDTNSISAQARKEQNEEIYKEVLDSTTKPGNYTVGNNVNNGRTRFNKALEPGDKISFELNKSDSILERDRYFVLANGERVHTKNAPKNIYDDVNSLSKKELKDFMSGIEINR